MKKVLFIILILCSVYAQAQKCFTKKELQNDLELKFSDYFANLYNGTSFLITYIDEGGKTVTANIEGTDSDIVDKSIRNLIPEKAFDLTLIDDDNKIAVLSFNSAEVSLGMAQGLFKESFNSINKAGIEHLIIDARFNGGGTDLVGNELLKYISDMPFRQYEGADTKISHRLVNKIEWYKNSSDIMEILKREGTYIIPVEDENRFFIDPYSDSVRFNGKKNC